MANQKSYSFARTTRFLGFLIGIFGAMAILGVFFKIIEWGPWEIFMWLGFMGEAAAFIVMGLLELATAIMMDPEAEAEASRAGDGSVQVARADVSAEVSASFREMMEEQMSDELNQVMSALSSEVKRFGSEVHAMAEEMSQARTAVQEMRGEIAQLSEGQLANDAQVLGQSLRHLGEEMHEMSSEMEESRAVVKDARGVLDKVASSNLAGDAERFEQGMKLLSEEIHAMGTEMGPAREAVEGMRTELDKVVSGDLAGDAERLSSGMRVLGDEMQGAGRTVEQIRDDLDHMAARFRQFNHPFSENHEEIPSTNHKPKS